MFFFFNLSLVNGCWHVTVKRNSFFSTWIISAKVVLPTCECVCVCFIIIFPCTDFLILLPARVHPAKLSFVPFPFLSATSLSSLSLSAFNPWLETAGTALSGGLVQSKELNLIQRGEASQIAGNVYFAIGRKTVSLFFSFFFQSHMSICI